MDSSDAPRMAMTRILTMDTGTRAAEVVKIRVMASSSKCRTGRPGAHGMIGKQLRLIDDSTCQFYSNELANDVENHKTLQT